VTLRMSSYRWKSKTSWILYPLSFILFPCCMWLLTINSVHIHTHTHTHTHTHNFNLLFSSILFYSNVKFMPFLYKHCTDTTGRMLDNAMHWYLCVSVLLFLKLGNSKVFILISFCFAVFSLYKKRRKKNTNIERQTT